MLTRPLATSLAAALALAALCLAAQAAGELVVSQKNKKFSTATLKVRVGDTVVFKNDDPFFHNIFSLSEIQPFDLGSFPQGQSRKVTFEKAGRIDIECAIHPEMRMTIDVTP